MFGHHFYNSTTRKYIAVFGTIFNDIYISRQDDEKTFNQRMKVPISYGPKQKFLSMLTENRQKGSQAITLPRISFEIRDIAYDTERKLPNSRGIIFPSSTSTGTAKSMMKPVPYNIQIELSIMTKYLEDGYKILEQIFPFFTPDFIPSARLIDGSNESFDIPIVLNSVMNEDTYEGSYEESRTLIWTLQFTIKGLYFGPATDKKIIKFAKVDINEIRADGDFRVADITVQPGMDSEGNATKDITKTIPYLEIEKEDNWEYIVTIEDHE